MGTSCLEKLWASSSLEMLKTSLAIALGSLEAPSNFSCSVILPMEDISKKCDVFSCKIIHFVSDAKFKLSLSRTELGPKVFPGSNYTSGEGSDVNMCVVKEHAVHF